MKMLLTDVALERVRQEITDTRKRLQGRQHTGKVENNYKDATGIRKKHREFEIRCQLYSPPNLQ